MKTKSWVYILVAAVLVIIGGAILGFAEETVLKVKVDSSDSIKVFINGELTEINLDDLADGEERVIEAGEHTIIVKRVGDSLTVTLDGNELGDPQDMVWFGDEGDHEGMLKKVMVIKTGDEECDEGGHKVIMLGHPGMEHPEGIENIDVIIKSIEGALGEEAFNIEVIKEHLGEHILIDIDEEMHGHGENVFLKRIGAHADQLRFVCENDGAELTIKKSDATQEAYMCPVCGREMKKAPEVKVMHLMTTIDIVEDDVAE